MSPTINAVYSKKLKCFTGQYHIGTRNLPVIIEGRFLLLINYLKCILENGTKWSSFTNAFQSLFPAESCSVCFCPPFLQTVTVSNLVTLDVMQLCSRNNV